MLKSNGKMMPENKPLWYWDDSVKRYRNPVTGRFVGIDEMNSLRSVFMQSQKDRMVGVTNVFASGTIDSLTYERQVKEILRQTYIDNYVMGKGGRNMMTQADWGSVGGMIHEQYKYLNPFLAQIERGELSQAQIEARLRMYINSASEAFWRGFSSDIPIDLPAYPGDGSTACLVNCQCQWHIVQVPGGYDAYWRLGVAEHCPDCVERARIWNPYRIRVTGEASNAG